MFTSRLTRGERLTRVVAGVEFEEGVVSGAGAELEEGVCTVDAATGACSGVVVGVVSRRRRVRRLLLLRSVPPSDLLLRVFARSTGRPRRCRCDRRWLKSRP